MTAAEGDDPHSEGAGNFRGFPADPAIPYDAQSLACQLDLRGGPQAEVLTGGPGAFMDQNIVPSAVVADLQ